MNQKDFQVALVTLYMRTTSMVSYGAMLFYNALITLYDYTHKHIMLSDALNYQS